MQNMNQSNVQGDKMSDFLLNDALTFINIVEQGSFAKAATYLGLSASVVSKRMSRLENQLEAQLLQRTTRSIALTEAGQYFYEHCKRIKAQMTDAALEISKHHLHPSGLLRINAPMSFGQVHLVSAIHDFMRLYPDIQVELILGSQYANFIHNGLDIAIFIKDLPNTDLLRSQRIALRSTGVYGSPAYLEQHGVPMVPADLMRHNCMLHQSGPATQLSLGQKREWRFIQEGEVIQVPVTGTFRVNSSQALVQAALAGMGLVRLSSFMVTTEVKEGRLLSVLPAFCPRDIDIHAAYSAQRYVPSKINVFIQYLKERFSSDHYWDKSAMVSSAFVACSQP